MPAIYTCDCQEGRTLTATAKWTPSELRQMSPLQLSSALSEITDFTRYYSSAFFYPRQQLEAEMTKLSRRYDITKQCSVCLGIIAGVFTSLWILLAVIPAMRFSALTLILAFLTFFSIILLIPAILCFIPAQEDYSKRYPRIRAKREHLLQEMEKEIFGNYADYLVTGFILTPEYALWEEGLNYMISALNSRNAANLTEAAMLCKKKLGRSPIPKIVLSLHAASSSGETASRRSPKKRDLSALESQGPDLQTVIQLSDYLHSAIQNYAANQPSADLSAEKSPLTMEEQSVIDDYRCLTDDEKKRIRRILHSFCSGQY